MFRTLLLAALTLFSLFGYSAQLLPITELHHRPEFTEATLNPAGTLLVSHGYPERRLTIALTDPITMQTKQIFQAKKFENVYIRALHWIDNDTLYLKTWHKLNGGQKSKRWIAEVNTDNGLNIKLKQAYTQATVIDPLPKQEDQLLFVTSKVTEGKLRQEVYHSSVKALVNNSFKERTKFKYPLQKEGVKYHTDEQGRVRFAKSYDFKSLKTSAWYLNHSNEWQLLYEYNTQNYSFSPIGFTGPDTIAVMTNMISDKVAVYEYDLKEKKLTNLLFQHPRYDIRDAKLHPESKQLEQVSYIEYGLLNSRFFAKREASLNAAFQKAFPNQQVAYISKSQDESKYIIRVSSSNTPGEFYYFNASNHQAKFIGTHFNKLSTMHFQESRALRLNSGDGHKVEAFLTRPAIENDNYTLLVMPHGGPIGVMDTQTFNFEVQYLANRGYSILQVNYRGSSGYGKAFKEMGRGQFGKRIEQDITAAVNLVSDQYPFDHHCSIGASYGGYSATMLAIQHPEFYDCVVARFGVYDLPLIFNDRDSKLERNLRSLLEGPLAQYQPDRLIATSPVYLANKLNAPVLITAGVKDKRASFEHSNRLKYVLEQQGKDVEHLWYQESGHGHRNFKSSWHEWAYIDDFIRRKLKLGKPKSKVADTILKHEYKLIANGFKDMQVLGFDKERYQEYMQRVEAL